MLDLDCVCNCPRRSALTAIEPPHQNFPHRSRPASGCPPSQPDPSMTSLRKHRRSCCCCRSSSKALTTRMLISSSRLPTLSICTGHHLCIPCCSFVVVLLLSSHGRDRIDNERYVCNQLKTADQTQFAPAQRTRWQRGGHKMPGVQLPRWPPIV